MKVRAQARRKIAVESHRLLKHQIITIKENVGIKIHGEHIAQTVDAIVRELVLKVGMSKYLENCPE